MQNQLLGEQMLLLCFVVDQGLARKALKSARQEGIKGATIFLGTGCIRDEHVLTALDLCDTRKEIMIMAGPEKIARKALARATEKLHLEKRHCGVSFAIPICHLLGSHSYDAAQAEACQLQENKEDAMHQAIYTIVDKGRGEQVIVAAKKGGARGGTIINARGSGIHETARLFAMEIEPEKEMVLIIAESGQTEAIVSQIEADLELEKAGKGILFTMNVQDVTGLRAK